MNGVSVRKASNYPFYLLIFYLFLEYARPQSIIPFLSPLHLPAVTAVLLALFLIFSGKVDVKDAQTIIFLLFLGLMIIHGPIALNNYWALTIFISMFLNFIVFMSIINFVNDLDKYNKLLKFWIMIHILLAIYGIVNKGRGIGGFLGDENDFCMTINMIIPFVFFMAISCENMSKKILLMALTCLFIFVVILTESRGGFVGLVAAGIYCWFRSKNKIITAFFLIVVTIFMLVVAPSKYWEEVKSIFVEGTQTGTGEERMYTWKVGWNMFLDNPVIGVGQGNFPFEFRKYEEALGFDEGLYGRSRAGRAAHSIYFTLLPELGFIGSLLFFAMILSVLKALKLIKPKHEKKIDPSSSLNNRFIFNIGLALEGSLFTYLVSGAFISILYYPNFWILVALITSLKNIISGNLKYRSIAHSIS